MAKPTKYATLICLILTAVLLAGVILGIYYHLAWIIVLFLLPAVGYEVYRTMGESTRWASIFMAIVIVAELIVVAFNINVDLVKLLGSEGQFVGGYYVQFGDLRVVFMAVLAILALILFFRTRGKYTRWLAVLIFVGALAIAYTTSPETFKQLLNIGAQEALQRI